MNFEPQKFFIGLIDFFSVLLPGAVLTFLIKFFFAPALLGGKSSPFDDTEKTVIFLIGSYLIGHLLFLFGSYFDYLYDYLKKRTEDDQVERLARGKNLSNKLVRVLASLFFKNHTHNAEDKVCWIKDKRMAGIGAQKAINAFQWSKLKLAGEFQEALSIVNRFEANSKFFRSFCPILILSILAFVLCGVSASDSSPFKELFKTGSCSELNPYNCWLWSGGSLFLLFFSLWAYMEQRFKSTQQAYWSVLTMLTKPGSQQFGDDASPSIKPGEATHAGGVVFRKSKRGAREYLLVQAKDNPDSWVLPKGHRERFDDGYEDARYCAIREVREETGVWARILRRSPKNGGEEEGGKETEEIELTPIEFEKNGGRIKTRVYLMEFVKQERPHEDRSHAWLSYEKAKKRATHKETRDALDEAEEIIGV